MDLYMKGISYRGIQDTLNQFTSLHVHHTTIMRWIRTYTAVMDDYIATLEPEVGKLWHADEQVIKVKGKLHYVWNCLDSRTRFLLATRVSKSRTLKEAKGLFKDAKTTAGMVAKKVITDGFNTYETAVKKEFGTHANPNPHIRYVSLRQPKGNNNRLERYHSSFRQRDKTMRGFKRKKSAQQYVIGYRTYYNFIRKHQTLQMTPAQAAGLNVSNNWKELLQKSLTNKEILEFYDSKEEKVEQVFSTEKTTMEN